MTMESLKPTISTVRDPQFVNPVEFTKSNKRTRRRRCASRACRRHTDVVGGSAYNTLEWHDHLLIVWVLSVAPYNSRTSGDLKDIEHRIKDSMTGHGENVQ
ncbi:hypothetical protein SAMN05443574_1169 [Haloarcula vallismortis]|uniref:Uncharacterized protein n=1 Tax=Haloarcula vallismortis TaxID=28442 RepID=A0A1H2ZD45_HALVA|nr:hypothetical protein SAMN05443574_1169 [Haloarcula vallismortis]